MARTQRSIQSFARISKPTTTDIAGSKKRKQIIEEQPASFVRVETACKKQRLQLQTPPDTPTKVLKHVLSNMHISVPMPPVLKSVKRKRAGTPELETPPTTPEGGDDGDEIDEDLPEQLEDLVAIQSSFLKALTLHYAHHGSASPVDVRLLTPTVTKVWRKRKVTIEDIKLCLGITYNAVGAKKGTNTKIALSNYGNGKICIEMETARSKKRGVLAQAFDESELNTRFNANLDKAWQNWKNKANVDDFVKSLPLTAVTECSSYTKLKPSFEKGQRHLDDILGPRTENAQDSSQRQKRRRPNAGNAEEVVVKMEESEPETLSIVPKDKENTTPPPTANFRALSLLDRIQKKQDLHSLNAAHRPTKAALDRLAALQRAEEFIQILELLLATKGPSSRASFPLPSLVRSVQSSLRSPMSTEEIERCVAVIAKEVAPGYCDLKVFGSMKGVVVNRLFKPDSAKVRKMAEEASTY